MEHNAYEPLCKGEEVFRALADQTRIRIVRLLFICGEAAVGELVDALRLPQYSVSRHLSILRHAGIVSERREGVWRYYSIVPKPESFAGRVLSLTESGLNEEILETDLSLFKKRLALRVDGKCVVGIDGSI